MLRVDFQNSEFNELYTVLESDSSQNMKVIAYR